MQHAIQRVERPGGSQEASDGKKLDDGWPESEKKRFSSSSEYGSRNKYSVNG